ncbi:MAG: glycogen/starch synthase [Luteolibacter sp.]
MNLLTRESESTGESKDANGVAKLRVLMVTPEITSLPEALMSQSPKIAAKGGGLADMAALLADGLGRQGVDLHVAMPHYRRIFGVDSSTFSNGDWKKYKRKAGLSNVHLAEDRNFYHRDKVYSNSGDENPDAALAFQREVINNILMKVDPDIVHCHDWMTGLVPAAAKRLGIPCVFTIHNIHTERISLAHIEHMGIDAAEFWQSLYFERYPHSYEESRESNRVDLLSSGILAADCVNTVSSTFLEEIINGRHGGLSPAIRDHLAWKRANGSARGILNAPHPSYDPGTDCALEQPLDQQSPLAGKLANKLAFQERTGLSVNPGAPLFFWPSRLDPMQKGCQLLTEILYHIVSDHSDSGLQIALVADGPFQQHFKDIVKLHGIRDRVSVCDFNEDLSRLGYAASDFTLMPSLYEPCGLAQMIALRYGSLPLVHGTGGLRDTVTDVDFELRTGNGFVFEHPDSEGLRWATDQAMRFFSAEWSWRNGQVARIMHESALRFQSGQAISDYMDMYEHLVGSFRGETECS